MTTNAATMIALEALARNTSTQMRAEITNKAHVELLDASLDEMAFFDKPVELALVEGQESYLVTDGFHRTEVYRQRGYEEFPAIVRHFKTQLDVRKQSAKSNLTHDVAKAMTTKDMEKWIEVMTTSGLIEADEWGVTSKDAVRSFLVEIEREDCMAAKTLENAVSLYNREPKALRESALKTELAAGTEKSNRQLAEEYGVGKSAVHRLRVSVPKSQVGKMGHTEQETPQEISNSLTNALDLIQGVNPQGEPDIPETSTAPQTGRPTSVDVIMSREASNSPQVESNDLERLKAEILKMNLTDRAELFEWFCEL